MHVLPHRDAAHANVLLYEAAHDAINMLFLQLEPRQIGLMIPDGLGRGLGEGRQRAYERFASELRRAGLAPREPPPTGV